MTASDRQTQGVREQDRQRVVFHVPFKLGYAISGGGIRPGKLIQAFQDLGYAVDVVSGPKAEREKVMQAVAARLERGERYAFCYAESSVLPTMLTEKSQKPFYPFVDFDFFRLLKERGVPLGLFYRDIYWRFPFHMRTLPLFTRMRRIFFHHLDFWYYGRLLDRLFLPSVKLAYLLPERLRRICLECPPGHDVEGPVERPAPTRSEDLSILYVGGVSTPVYDISPLMRLGARFPVTICCRVEEWRQYAPYYADLAANVRVVHLSGEDLRRAYAGHSLSAILRVDHEYLSFAAPLKLYEAVGQNIPLLVSRGSAAAEFVERNGIGWCVDNSFADLDADALVREYPAKVGNLLAMKAAHHWRERARFIQDTLLGGGPRP